METAVAHPSKRPGRHYLIPDAQGVQYENTSIAGQLVRLFRCETLSLTLTPEGCASRHKEARRRGEHDDASGYTRCRTCPIGAAHAGLGKFVPRAPHECCRCGKWSDRLVGKVLCPSCYNRQREALKGRDRRGRKPHVHVRLWQPGEPRERGRIDAVFALTVLVNGRPEQYTVATFIEAFEQAIRVHPGRRLTLAIPGAARLVATMAQTQPRTPAC